MPGGLNLFFAGSTNESNARLVILSAPHCSRPCSLSDTFGQLSLSVNRSTGGVQLVNSPLFSDGPISFDAYHIKSAAGSLNPGGWFSLQDQGFSSWSQVGGSSETLLGEAKLVGGHATWRSGSRSPSGIHTIRLSGIEDLEFEYAVVGGTHSAGPVHLRRRTVPAGWIARRLQRRWQGLARRLQRAGRYLWEHESDCRWRWRWNRRPWRLRFVSRELRQRRRVRRGRIGVFVRADRRSSWCRQRLPKGTRNGPSPSREFPTASPAISTLRAANRIFCRRRAAVHCWMTARRRRACRARRPPGRLPKVSSTKVGKHLQRSAPRSAQPRRVRIASSSRSSPRARNLRRSPSRANSVMEA